MSAIDLARSHVERYLLDVWGIRNPRPDPAGNYGYTSGGVACWIRLETVESTMVRFAACAAVEVPRSAKLLAELNEINARCRTAYVSWRRGLVIVEQAMLASALDRQSLAFTSQLVARIANDIAPMITTVFGGRTPLPSPEAAS